MKKQYKLETEIILKSGKNIHLISTHPQYLEDKSIEILQNKIVQQSRKNISGRGLFKYDDGSIKKSEIAGISLRFVVQQKKCPDCFLGNISKPFSFTKICRRCDGSGRIDILK